MSSLLAGGMQNGAITAQDEAYLPRKKKNKPHPTPYQWHHESVPHLLEKPLSLAAVFHTGFKVSQLTRIHLWVRGQGLSHCKPILHNALSIEIDI